MVLPESKRVGEADLSAAYSCGPLPRLQPNSGLPEFGRLIDRPKSETSDFGWRDREGACKKIHVCSSPPPHPSPASGGGCRLSAPRELTNMRMKERPWLS